jgi:hypothetical protein
MNAIRLLGLVNGGGKEDIKAFEELDEKMFNISF